MKTKEITKVRDAADEKTRSVLPQEEFPRENFETVEQMIPVTDDNGNILMQGQRIKADYSLGKWQSYTPEFIASQGMSLPNMPHKDSFGIVDEVRESQINNKQD